MLRIATRRSALARAQAELTGRALAARSGEPFELVPMATSGDLAPQRAVAEFETKGLFVDSIRRALLDGDCDLAVHSYKDLPTAPAAGLRLAAVPERADPRDALVSRGHALAGLPRGARVGTSSARRRAQLLTARPDLAVVAVRGNLDTRLRKVGDGQLDAVVVAVAGLDRLYPAGVGGLHPPVSVTPLEPDTCVPAAGQGALALECAADAPAAYALCALIDHPETRAAVDAERAFLAAAGGGCLAPVGALCRRTADGALELLGVLADDDGAGVRRGRASGRADDPAGLGRRLAARLGAPADAGPAGPA